MKLNIIWLVLILLALPLASAELYYPQGKVTTLTMNCIGESGGPCTAATKCNISITYNNDGSYLVKDQPMTNLLNGDFFYNVTFNNYGDYTFKTSCKSAASNVTSTYAAKVTQLGTAGTNADSISFLAVTIFILVVTGVLFFFPLIKPIMAQNPFTNLILRRSCWVVALWLMTLNAAIMASGISQTGWVMLKEMFQYMWLFGWAAYVMIIYLIVKTVFDLVKLWNEIAKFKRTGGDDYG